MIDSVLNAVRDSNSAVRRMEYSQDTGYKAASNPLQHTCAPTLVMVPISLLRSTISPIIGSTAPAVGEVSYHTMRIEVQMALADVPDGHRTLGSGSAFAGHLGVI
ncbi:hypothetical protein PG994_002213 [Apiospora phragmitis]|uniref:Uncharacterized protein n=1 Tax=Apiospora phragmitis TaxID=2905665 RepID=A0ABR1WVP8_9PEZI